MKNKIIPPLDGPLSISGFTIFRPVNTVKEVHKARKIRLKVIYETPDYSIEKSCREQLGLADPLKYWEWQMRMKQEWEDSKNDR